MIYDRENQKAIYTSKRGTLSYEPLDWLAAITSHIPNKGAQNVHYYGLYSNKSRGIQKKSEQVEKGEPVIADILLAKKYLSKTIDSFYQKDVRGGSPLLSPVFSPYENNFDH